MIIINQDRKSMISFDNIASVYVDTYEDLETKSNCFCIKAENSVSNLICEFLGEYKTEERAQEVFDDIVTTKAMFELYKYADNDTREAIAETMQKENLIFDIYEMPKE